jgi:Mrp family chromosome partitioning ATPase
MDSIKQAVELARSTEGLSRQGDRGAGLADGLRSAPVDAQVREVRLNSAHLEGSRIVAHGASSEHGRYYDMLRTQVLQEMDKKSWQFLAVTSPTAACGKTVTACNLALSIARLPGRLVLLVDLDLRKPRSQSTWASARLVAYSVSLKGVRPSRRRSSRPVSVQTVCWFCRAQFRPLVLRSGWHLKS